MKKLMNSRISIVAIIALILFSTMLIASIMNSMDDQVPLIDVITDIDSTSTWKPTKEDIAYQDSMYQIIQNTQQDVDTIKEDIDRILYKLERIEHSDGTVDSIRYVKGSPIDKRKNN